MEDMKGKWLVVVVNDRNDFTKSICESRQRKYKHISLYFLPLQEIMMVESPKERHKKKKRDSTWD